MLAITIEEDEGAANNDDSICATDHPDPLFTLSSWLTPKDVS